MKELAQYFTVYLAGTTGIYKGVPMGIALGLPPHLSALFTSLGSVSSVLLLYIAGDKFRDWILQKHASKRLKEKQEKFTYWMDKYGLAGLGLMVTALLGPIIALIIGMTLLKETRKFITYLILGIIIWSFTLAYLADPVVQFFRSLTVF